MFAPGNMFLTQPKPTKMVASLCFSLMVFCVCFFTSGGGFEDEELMVVEQRFVK
jgi:hypothetical protein